VAAKIITKQHTGAQSINIPSHAEEHNISTELLSENHSPNISF